MPTKRKDFKEFSIGSKIEYMNKLFEVTESNQCCDCSITSICSSSAITSGNKISDVLSRDQRINIFGECSKIHRNDNTPIVFKEIS